KCRPFLAGPRRGRPPRRRTGALAPTAGRSGPHPHPAIERRCAAADTAEYVRNGEVALSARRPIQRCSYASTRAKPYLFGLLPENEDARAACSDQLGVSVDDAFGILAVMGWDCPGAVQFCREEDLEELRTRKGEHRPISDTEIAERVRALVGDELSWAIADEHWSRGGRQEKFARARIDGCWHTAHGAPSPRTSSGRGLDGSTWCTDVRG